MKGVFEARHKDNSIYYRASVTYKRKHISLGSYNDESTAHAAYEEALSTLNGDCTIDDYDVRSALSFDKYVSLINVRDNNIYISNPIYIRPKMFYYYLSREEILKFDVDDLFYYSSHRIMKRGNHLFVADYGMQVNIAGRYGIKNHAVIGRDYDHLNGDRLDYRYSNIVIHNSYNGVSRIIKNGEVSYKATIHIRGNYSVGIYDTIEKAAIAYNKAADIINSHGCRKQYSKNYIDDMPSSVYREIYDTLPISEKLLQLYFEK